MAFFVLFGSHIELESDIYLESLPNELFFSMTLHEKMFKFYSK